METSARKIAVMGSGAWGTALAHLMATRHPNVYQWVREADVESGINELHENTRFLPGIQLHPGIMASRDPERVLAGADFVVNVIPTQFIRPTWTEIGVDQLSPDAIIVNASKGIEQESLFLVSQIFDDLFPSWISSRFCVLSGPSFAEEVVRGLPTSVALAAPRESIGREVAQILHLPHFRVYTTLDLMGVQLGGALKNVIAIAAGAVDGMGLGNNTRAAVITRGLAEIARLGARMGAHTQTFFGLSGLGDLVLTTTGQLSRNRTVGLRIGAGESLADILDSMESVAEGVPTAKSAYMLAQRHQVDMPITQAVYDGLYLSQKPQEALWSILSRSLKADGV